MSNLDTSEFLDLISGVDGGQFEYVDAMPLDDCYPDLEQPRYKNLTEDGVQDILATLPSTNGRIWQPIIVREYDDAGHKILMGGRRWLASKVYGSESIPVIIVKGDVDSALFLQLMENIARKPLDVREEGRSYKLLKEQGQEQKEIAASLGKSQAYIAEAIMMHDMDVNENLDFLNKLYEDEVCQDTSTLAVFIRFARKNVGKTKQLIAWALDNECLNRKWAKSLNIKNIEMSVDEQIAALEDRKSPESRPNAKVQTPAGTFEKPSLEDADEDFQLELEQDGTESKKEKTASSANDSFQKKRITEINVMHQGQVAKLLLDRADNEEGFAWIQYNNIDMSALRVDVSELSLIFVG
jgi:ParB family chromosome partitioning protein